ncbi:MAG: tetratricopeptide repeat protein [Flavobacteriales bacterium]|nr:tetratricopeptide repeat protein [Flavobacteriales bacterium]
MGCCRNLLILLLFFHLHAAAQHWPAYGDYKRHFDRNEPDSLDALARRLAADSDPADQDFIELIRATAAFRRDDLENALFMLTDLEARADRTAPLLKGIVLRLLSVTYSNLGAHDRAVTDAAAGIAVLQDTPYKEELMASWVVKAEALIALNKLEQAMHALETAQSLADTTRSDRGASMIRLAMGSIRYKQGRYEEARADFTEASRIAVEGGHYRIAQAAIGNLGGVATMLGSFAEAEAIYQNLLRILGRKSPEIRARLHGQLGYIRLEQGRYDEAIVSCRRAIALADSIGDHRNAADAQHDLAYAIWSLHGAAMAEGQMRAALLAFDSLNWLERAQAAHYDLYELLKELGRHEESAEHLAQYAQISDSLGRSKHSTEMARLEMLFETERKEHRIAEQQQALALSTAESRRRTLQRNALIGATIALGLVALLLYRVLRHRQRMARQQKALHDQQVDQLLSQQEIKSINAMLEGQEKERDRMAKDLHDRLGSMLGGIKANMSALEDRVEAMRQDQQYQKVTRLLDQTVSELRHISHDMAAATLSRFGLEKALNDLRDTIHISGRLQVELNTFGLDQRLERGVEITVYRIVQELVSNVLKHAKADQLTIGVTRAPGRLSVVVSDNGVGFDPSTASNGMGLSNVRSRAASLGATVQVDSAPSKGTTVSVESPVLE